MTPNFYVAMEQALTQGLALGWNRAHKHVDNPSPADVQAEQETAIMSALFEWFDMPETPPG